MDKKLYLLKKIEICRKEMVRLTITEDFTSDAVIAASARLDQLLNEYNKVASY